MAAAVPSIVRAPGVTPGADYNDANQADRPGVPDLVVLVSEASATFQLLADVPAKWEDRPGRTIARNTVSLLLSQFASAPDSDFSEGWGLFDVHLQLEKLRELDAKVVAHSSLDLSGCKTFDQACRRLREGMPKSKILGEDAWGANETRVAGAPTPHLSRMEKFLTFNQVTNDGQDPCVLFELCACVNGWSRFVDRHIGGATVNPDLVALAGVVEGCTMAPLVAGGNWEAKYPVIAKGLVHLLTATIPAAVRKVVTSVQALSAEVNYGKELLDPDRKSAAVLARFARFCDPGTLLFKLLDPLHTGDRGGCGRTHLPGRRCQIRSAGRPLRLRYG